MVRVLYVAVNEMINSTAKRVDLIVLAFVKTKERRNTLASHNYN